MTEVAALGLSVDSESMVPAISRGDRLADTLAHVGEAADGLPGPVKRAGGAVKGAGDEAQKTTGAFGRMAAMISGSTNRALVGLASVAGSAAGRIAALAAAGFGLNALRAAADGWSDMQSVVGAAIKDMEAAPAVMEDILRLANASYSPLEQTARGFAANVGALRDLGISTQGALDYTEALNHALVITATRGERAASVQNALSKAMAVGRLQADGLETVLANGGRVAEALANELGTNVAGLRALASEGKITGAVIASALTGELANLREEAAEMPMTITDGFVKIGNGLTAVIGRFDQATGASAALAEQMNGLAEWLALVAQSDFSGWLASVADGVADLASLVLILAATRLPALTVSLYASATAAWAANAGILAARASTALMIAQMYAGVIAARGLAGALALVGGPLGLVAAGVTAVAIAYSRTPTVAQTATSATEAYKAAQEGLNAAIETFTKEKSKDNLTAMQEAARQALDTAAAMVASQEAVLDAARAQAGSTIGNAFTGATISQAQLDEDTQRIDAAQAALTAARISLVEAQGAFALSIATVADGTTAAATAAASLTAEQEKALVSAQAMAQEYRNKAELARIEAQHGRDSAQYLATQLQQERAIQFAKIAALDVSRQQKDEIRAAYDEMVRTEAATNGWRVSIGRTHGPLQASYDWLVKISETQPGDTWLDTAIRKASSLAARLWDAVAGIDAVSAVEVDDAGNVISTGGPTRANRPKWRESTVDGGATGSAGGAGAGGGGSDQYASNLQSLIESLQTEQATVDAWYESSQNILNDRRAAEILGVEAHQQAIEALEQEHQNRLAAIRQAETDRQIQGYSDFFGALASVAQAGGGRLVKIAAVFGAVQGTIDAYGAYLKALNSPVPMTPWGRAAAALNVLAAGLKGVMAIKQAGGAGGGGGAVAPAGSGSGAGQSQAQSAPQVISITGVNRDQNYSGGQLMDLVNAMMGELKNRGAVIQFI